VRAALGAIRSASLSVVHLGFDADDVSLPDGFGALVPRREGRDGLGILFVSTLLPNRAPGGRVTTTSFFGGIRAPEWVARSEAELCAAACREHRELLGIDAQPVMCHVQRWQGAIPQYEFASEPLTDALERYERTRPTLHFAGRYRGGVSVPDCWRRGRKMAEEILAASSSQGRAERTDSLAV
jgi:oxygen-dependent protoporphyrinogen oxidase